MQLDQALDQIETAIATFCPVPMTQEALSKIEQALEGLENTVRDEGYRDGYDKGFYAGRHGDDR